MLGIEVNGGVFEAGRIPKQGIQGKSVTSGGVSARVTFFTNDLEPARSIDYRLYRNNPELMAESGYFLRTPRTYERFTIRVSGELNALFQTLGDFDRPLSTKVVDAYAGALRTDFFIGNVAVNVDAVYKDLPFILFNVPSLDPFLSLPEAADTAPELMLAAKVEYWIESANLIPGIVLGLQAPASYRGRVSQTTNPGGLTGAEQTVVVPEAGTIIPFPDGKEPLEIWSCRAQLRWDPSQMLSFIGQLTYSYDPNQLGRKRDQLTQTAEYFFRDPDVLGLAFFAQARF